MEKNATVVAFLEILFILSRKMLVFFQFIYKGPAYFFHYQKVTFKIGRGTNERVFSITRA